MIVYKKYVSKFDIIYRPRFKDNIPGYPGYYISKRGRVYTRKRINSGRKSKGGLGQMNTLGYWKELTSVLNNKGYKRVVIRSPNKNRLYTQVSRLVALVYVPNPYNYPFVCHKDNNPLNNYYKNLYWGTQSMNIIQMYNDGRRKF